MGEIETEGRLTRVEESTKSAHHRIDELKEVQITIHALALSVNSLAGTMQTVCTEVSEVKSGMTDMSCRIKSIELQPGTRWDKLIDAAWGALVGGLIVYAITYFLKG